MNVLPVALNHSPSPSGPPVCLQLIPGRLSHEKGIAIQLFHDAAEVTVGLQEFTNIVVIIGNLAPDPERTAQVAAAGQVAYGIGVAIAAGLVLNRFDQDPQVNHGLQDPQ
jgi:hypothetical protein